MKAEKLQWLAGNRLLDFIEGIPNKEEDLLELFGEQQEEGLVLGGIQASEEVKAFLRLDPKFRIFRDLDRLKFETEVETTAAKQRFSRSEDMGETVS